MPKGPAKPKKQVPASPGVRLNKFIANAGIASRRKADELIAAGKVTVNGTVVVEMGHRILASDVVMYMGKRVKPANHVYVLLNKPKDFITTTSDERGRKTVMSLVQKATQERIYPVGRLDRQTTGLLLFTNDGDLAQKLTHPSFQIEKVYGVTLDKPLATHHFDAIKRGVQLEEGVVPVDDLAYTNSNDKREVGIALHVGWNRVVRRLFESLGYEVKKLDRTIYAGLTKKDLPRGRWRYLAKGEVTILKHLLQ